jgi:TAG lipase/steryl ester hydrolase/phospholipase A2/LPA acyltransferase
MQRYIDGSVGGDLPMQRMSELFNVNTFIVSQVNPHVVPFISIDGGGVLESRTKKRLSMTLKSFVGNEIKHGVDQLNTLGLIPPELMRGFSFLHQPYKGHVTIIPQPKLAHYRNLLINPNHQDYIEAIQESYNCTLRKISLIRAIYGVEREFDRYYLRLKHQSKILELNHQVLGNS